jgi:glycerol 2-dehydrogenase (NADP+)
VEANWELVNRGVAVLPKSVTKERIVENGRLVDLDQEDMKALENLHKEKGFKRFITPPWPVDFLFGEANWNSAYKPLIPVQI